MAKDSQVTIASNGQGGLVIAGWTLHEARHRLERDGQSVKLEPKTTELLGYLARHAGEPLSREAGFALEAFFMGNLRSQSETYHDSLLIFSRICKQFVVLSIGNATKRRALFLA